MKGGAALLLCLCLPAGAGEGRPGRLASWVVYWDVQRGTDMLAKHGNGLDQVSVFAAHFDGRHRLTPANPWVAEAPAGMPRTPGRLLLTAVNDVVGDGEVRLKDPAAVHSAVSTPRDRARHVEELVALAAWADGVEIDYERIRSEDREAFSLFVHDLAEALHRRGKVLSVVVEPKTSDVRRDGAGAVDWGAVGRDADAVKVMAYFEHHEGGPPGPPASPAWVEEVARFALTQVPREKLWIALTVAGIDWPEGGRGRQLDYARIRTLPGRPRRHRRSGAQCLRYRDAEGRRHQVWFEDARSIDRKMEALERAGVTQVALWRLGVGDPALWRRLEKSGSDLN